MGEMVEAAASSIYIGRSVKPEFIYLRLANRHGLITGDTGTGKTVTLQGLAEGFSDQGVPVFCADVKGDLSGLAEEGEPKPWIGDRAKEIDFKPEFRAYPVIFWDLFGEQGHPLRTTVARMGAPLLSWITDLSEAEEGVLNIAFQIAEREKLPLIYLEDLAALLEDLTARADTLSTNYGNVTEASVCSLQRSLLRLAQQVGTHLFGEPAFDIHDLMREAQDGRGYISILAAERLMKSPRLYAILLLFFLLELFRALPEVDLDKPKLVFFFEEAHLLFRDAPSAVLGKVEQLMRLISSKGVGIYFVTQNPQDIPDVVSSELSNSVQHALHAFTPMARKELKVAAMRFRANPAFNTETAIMELGIGEALVSTLDPKGQPSMVEITLVKPPNSRVGPITDDRRKAIIKASPVSDVYDGPIDRGSAYQALQEPVERLSEVEVVRAAAQQGDADAQVKLGLMYENGQGIPRDEAEAVKWFRRAANQGNAAAQYNLRAWACGRTNRRP